ncbi:unnamed protein product [Pelagomonas calceolata]|uniref:Uncharacterized protein n=1 Tax=Pelagomonas calceolata TaxID=35677 RepID=A0A8J2WTH9_9STRA|nr:unnamed protein product [Pelagomonas calceolata]
MTALPSSASSATEYFESVASSSSSSPAPLKTDRSSGSRSPTRLDRFPAARFCARLSLDKSVDLAKSLGLPPLRPFFAIAASEARVAAFTWARYGPRSAHSFLCGTGNGFVISFAPAFVKGGAGEANSRRLVAATAWRALEVPARHRRDPFGTCGVRSTTSRQRPRRRADTGTDSDAAARSGTSQLRTSWRRSGPRRRRRAGRRRRPACASCPTANGTSRAATSSCFPIRSVETAATGARRVSNRADCPGSGSRRWGRASGRPSVPAPARWRAGPPESEGLDCPAKVVDDGSQLGASWSAGAADSSVAERAPVTEPVGCPQR